MSSTTKTSRRPLDAYSTDPRVALAVCRRLADMDVLFDGARVLEPHVGDDAPWLLALAQVARERGWTLHITVCDIDPEVRGLTIFPGLLNEVDDVVVEVLPFADFLVWGKATERRWDVTVGNPPFSDVEPGKKKGPVVAHKHIDVALRVSTWACMLTRIGLLTTSQQRTWGRDNPPPHRFDLWPRPSFTGKSSDSTEYTNGLWGPTLGAQTYEILDWHEVGRWPDGVDPQLAAAAGTLPW